LGLEAEITVPASMAVCGHRVKTQTSPEYFNERTEERAYHLTKIKN